MYISGNRVKPKSTTPAIATTIRIAATSPAEEAALS
jgi:hypothetical protein